MKREQPSTPDRDEAQRPASRSDYDAFKAWWAENKHKTISARLENESIGPFAAEAFLAGMAAVRSEQQRNEVPLCGGHAESWFCGRNHWVSGHDHCILCAYDATLKRQSERNST